MAGKRGKMKRTINWLNWFFWRITAYHRLSDYLHANIIGLLTPKGIEKMDKMAEKERDLWFKKNFRNYEKTL